MTKHLPAALIATALFLGLSGGAVHAAESTNNAFDRADASFSRFPLNMPGTPQAVGRLVNGDACDDDGISCEWEDEVGVRHIFAGDTLAIKLVDVAALGNRDIAALNIGAARSRADVLAKVRAFLPEIAVDCLEPGKAGEGAGIASCSGAFPNDAWFKLLFGPDGRLISARIDAFQID